MVVALNSASFPLKAASAFLLSLLPVFAQTTYNVGLLYLVNGVALAIGFLSVITLFSLTRSVGKALRKTVDSIIYGIIVMVSSSVYTLLALHFGFASLDSILSIQTVLMFVGFLFFLTAAYNLVKTLKFD